MGLLKYENGIVGLNPFLFLYYLFHQTQNHLQYSSEIKFNVPESMAEEFPRTPELGDQ